MVDLGIASEWIPVVSGAVGAGGAVSAQLVAGHLTSKREKKSTAQKREDERSALFRDERRQLFLRIIKLADTDRAALKRYNFEMYAHRIDPPSGINAEVMSKEWLDLLSELLLIDSEVHPTVERVVTTFASWDLAMGIAAMSTPHDHVDFHVYTEPLMTEIAAMTEAMRISLKR